MEKQYENIIIGIDLGTNVMGYALLGVNGKKPELIIQTPDNTQNFNRYSYCMNNPLLYVDLFGLSENDHKMLISDSGEVITMHCTLDEVEVIALMPINRNSGYSNMDVNFIYLMMFLNSYDFSPYYNDYGVSLYTGGSGNMAQITNHYLQHPTYKSYSPEMSKILGNASLALVVLPKPMKDSQATFTFNKYKDLYELKFSKKGYSKINRSKAYSVSGLSKALSWTGNFTSAVSAGYDFYDAYDSFSRNNIEKGLEYGVDGCVGLISIPLGIYGVAFDILWEYCYLKDAFWYTVKFNQEYVIMPEYSSGVLGLPSTMPYK